MATRAPFCSVKKSAASEKVALPSLPKKITQRQMSARFADRLNFSVKIGTFPNNSIVYSSVFTSFFLSKLPAAGRHYYGWTAGIQKTKGTCRQLAWSHFWSTIANITFINFLRNHFTILFFLESLPQNRWHKHPYFLFYQGSDHLPRQDHGMTSLKGLWCTANKIKIFDFNLILVIFMSSNSSS